MANDLTFEEKMLIRLESVESKVRNLQGRQGKLEEAWEGFVPAVTNRVTKEIIIPGMVNGLMQVLNTPIKLESSLPDMMDLKGLDIEALKDDARRAAIFRKKGDG